MTKEQAIENFVSKCKDTSQWNKEWGIEGKLTYKALLFAKQYGNDAFKHAGQTTHSRTQVKRRIGMNTLEAKKAASLLGHYLITKETEKNQFWIRKTHHTGGIVLIPSIGAGLVLNPERDKIMTVLPVKVEEYETREELSASIIGGEDSKSTQIRAVIYLNQITKLDYYKNKERVRISFTSDGKVISKEGKNAQAPNFYIGQNDETVNFNVRRTIGVGKDLSKHVNKYAGVADIILENIDSRHVVTTDNGGLTLFVNICVNSDKSVKLFQRPNFKLEDTTMVKDRFLGSGKVLRDWAEKTEIGNMIREANNISTGTQVKTNLFKGIWK